VNRKIYNKIVETVKASPAIMFNGSSMQNAIRGIFNVNIQVSDQDDLIKIADKTDKAVLEKYFAEVWQSKTKSYKYSGLSLIDEVNNLKPRSVLDIGCGFNEFKGKIHNVIGIDPYNKNADIQSSTLDYQNNVPFDVVISLGSINFGTVDTILQELKHAVKLTTKGGLMFFRVNPGKLHQAKEAQYIEFFDWNTEFILNSADLLGCQVVSIKPDGDRFYFVWKVER
jgi:SAM-dependent methyltransferase